jgi:hypothetical protein
MRSINPDHSKNRTLNLLPVSGTLVFIVLYIAAAKLYPGGSQADKFSSGFSWVNNYWCNLLNDNAINGMPNKGKLFASIGMTVLCFSLAVFWIQAGRYFSSGKTGRLLIQLPGMLSMSAALFLFTKTDHDLITNIASILGLIACIALTKGLYKKKYYLLFSIGLLNFLLVALNNYLYYSTDLIMYLPMVQKLTFAAFLIWMCCISVMMFNTSK